MARTAKRVVRRDWTRQDERELAGVTSINHGRQCLMSSALKSCFHAANSWKQCGSMSFFVRIEDTPGSGAASR
jgi:hypothetical protein